MSCLRFICLVWLNLLLAFASSCTNSGGASGVAGNGGGSSNQPVIDASGKKIYTIDPATGAVLSTAGLASSDPRFATAAVAIPPGSLSLPVSVSIFEAQPLANSEISAVVGSSNLTVAGPAVAVLPSQSVVISGGLAISIPYSTLTALTGDRQLLVLAVYAGTSKNELETFVGDELDTNTPGIVKISAKKFGAFQVVYSDNTIQKKNVETTAEIRSIADAPPPPRVPILSYAGSTGTAVKFGEPLSVAPTKLGNNGSPITGCGIKIPTTALPSWATVNPNTCVISGIPDDALGSTTYTLVATNSAGQSLDAAVTLSVEALIPSLSYTDAAGANGTVGAPLLVYPTTLAANGAAITACGLKSSSSALPSWAYVDATTCVISGTPDAILDPTSYTLVATNSVGQSTDATVSLSVVVSAPTLRYWEFPASLPGVPSTPPQTQFVGKVGMQLSISPTTLYANGSAIMACGIKSGTTALPSWATVNSTTCVISGTPNAELRSTGYILRATNGLGESTDATVGLYVGPGVPSLSYSGSNGTNGKFGVPMSVSPSTLTSNGASVTGCSIKSGTTALPTWANLNKNTCVISGTPNALLNGTSYIVVATNSVGQSADATVTLSVEPAVPTLSYTNATGRIGTFGVAMSVAPTILLNNGATIKSCGIRVPTTSLPSWASVDPISCVISGTPDAVLSTTTYTLVATNSAGQSFDATVSLSVGAAVPTLSYSGASGTNATFGTTMSVSPTTLATNGAVIIGCAIKFGTPALPNWATVNTNTCVISGTPNAVLSNTLYTLRATNSAGLSNDATVNLSVAATVPTLSYTGTTGITATYRVAISVAPVTFSNNGAPVTNCGVKSGTAPLPSWASVNSSTCVISGTPNSVLSATSFTLVATNSVGQSADATFLLAVEPAAPTLSYAEAANTSGIIGLSMSVAPTTLSDNGATVTDCRIKSGTAALPSWAVLNPTTCVISGTPNLALNATTYTIVASNSKGQSPEASVRLLVNYLTRLAIEAFPDTKNYPTITWTPTVRFSSLVSDTLGLYSDTIGTAINTPTIATAGVNTFVANSVTTPGQDQIVLAKNPSAQPPYFNLGSYKTKLPPNSSIQGLSAAPRALVRDSAGNIYAGGSFVFAGGVTANYVAKWNGSAWSALGTGMNSDVYALAVDSAGNLYAGGAFTTAGGVSAKYVAKWNGSAWSALGTGMNSNVYALAVDSAGYLYTGGYQQEAMTTGSRIKRTYVAKWNGSAWSALGSGMSVSTDSIAYDDATIRSLVFDSAGNLYAGGGFTFADGISARGVAKWNGSAWSALGSGMYGYSVYDTFTVKSLVFDSAGNLYAGGDFRSAGSVSANHVAKWNGSSWSPLGNGMGGGPFNNGHGADVNTLSVDSSGNLYAGGNFTTAGGVSANYVTKWNGSSWSTLGTGATWFVYALIVDATGNLYTGGAFYSIGGIGANCLAKWDGYTWNGLGSDISINREVNAIIMTPSGTLYAGGNFMGSRSANTNFVAKWDGSNWSALGLGTNGAVRALAVDSSGNIYAGGDFTTAGGITANYVAKWDGSNWSALGLGTNGAVRALAVDSLGNLYAGGDFTTASGVTANYVAKWDGYSWIALGSGMNSSVNALAIDSARNLYAGGIFSSAGGVSASKIAKWNGSSWSKLGDGMNSSVYALAIDPSDNLYAGGWFNTAGTVSAAYVAKWNGSSWSALGGGVGGNFYDRPRLPVSSLAVSPSGHLYVGGGFTLAGGMNANYVAKWNGSSWLSLDTGMGQLSIYEETETVRTLAVDATGNLYAGGLFKTAGSKLRPHIALWIDAFSTWF